MKNKLFFLLVYPIILLVILLSPGRVIAQGQLYEIDQVKHTEATLKSYLNDVFSPEDSVAGIIYFKPGKCPRCEGTFPYIFEHKNALALKNKLIIIADFENSSAVAKYCNDLGFKADYLVVDTARILYNSFKMTGDQITVPFLMLYDVKQGRILKSISVLGANISEAFINGFFNDPQAPRPMAEVASGGTAGAQEFSDAELFEAPFQTNYGCQKEFPYTKPVDPISNESNIAFIDDLFGYILVYRKNGDFVNCIYPTEDEYKIFKDETVDQVLFAAFRSSLKCIYLKILSITDNEITFVASLPQLSFNREKLTVDYYNLPAIIRKNLLTNEITKITAISEMPEALSHSRYVFKHSNISITEDGSFFMPLIKGWPAVGVDDLDLNDSLNNPFCDVFYKNTPTSVYYQADGKFIKAFGRISETATKLRLGFFANGMLFTKNQQYTVSVQAQLGEILFYKKDDFSNPVQKINLFDTGLNAVSGELIAQQKLIWNNSMRGADYFNQIRNVLKKEVLWCKMDDQNNLYLLWKDKRSKETFLSVWLWEKNEIFPVDLSKIFPVSDHLILTPNLITKDNENKVDISYLVLKKGLLVGGTTTVFIMNNIK